MSRRRHAEPSPEQRQESTPVSTITADIRPASLDEFVGQRLVVDYLRTMTAARREAGDAARHVLFSGPPGLGKTTLARIVAHEMGARLREASAPGIRRLGDLVQLMIDLEPRDVLFIDEIHALDRPVEELLYGAMEDHVVRWSASDRDGRQVELKLPPWTLVAATTRSALVTGALQTRFARRWELEPYSVEDMVEIVARSARVRGLGIEREACEEVARRCRDTPRVANGYLDWLADVARVEGDGMALSRVEVSSALDRLGVDSAGLDQTARRALEYLAASTRPVGLQTMAAALGVPEDTLQHEVEPFLLRRGLVERTAKGRRATAAGRAHVRSS